MKAIIEVSPFRCRVWDLHDRMFENINEESCRAEIASFKQHGQLVPVLARPLRDDADYDFELICGARRLYVARRLERPLLVEVREGLSDRDALIAMDIENRQRKDISAYERGTSYARWLRKGLFRSQDEIANVLKISPSQVSRLLKLARLPTVVVEAFGNAFHILEAWGGEIADALEQPDRRKLVIQTARRIAAGATRLAPQETYRRLIAAGQQICKERRSIPDTVVKDAHGRPSFRIRRRRNSIAILLPLDAVTAEALERIKGLLVDVLDDSRQLTIRRVKSLDAANPRHLQVENR